MMSLMVLYHKNSDKHCLVVPQELQVAAMEEAEGGPFAEHLAEKKVFDRLSCHVWWKGMRNDIHKFCQSCLVCSTRKGTRGTCKHPLQQIPVGGPFHRVGVDILQLPLTTKGNYYVVVFTDYLTKWPEAFAIPDQAAETIAKVLVKEVICRHGIPEELLSNGGAIFLSSLIQEIFELLGLRKINTAGYHPQTDGLVEKFNSTLINMIAKSSNVHDRDWDDHHTHYLHIV